MKKTITFVMACLLSVNAVSKTTVNNASSHPIDIFSESLIMPLMQDLSNTDCLFQPDANLKYQVSISALNSYEMDFLNIVDIQKKSWHSYLCGSEQTTIFVYQTKNRNDGRELLKIARGLINRGLLITHRHRERIYRVNNFVFVVSSRKVGEFDHAIFNYGINTTNDFIFEVIEINSLCDIKHEKSSSFCRVLDEFIHADYPPKLKSNYFGVGNAYFNSTESSKIDRMYALIARPVQDSFSFDLFDIKPDNEGQEKASRNYITSLENSKPDVNNVLHQWLKELASSEPVFTTLDRNGSKAITFESDLGVEKVYLRKRGGFLYALRMNVINDKVKQRYYTLVKIPLGDSKSW
ncbi:MAG: hypothetical protein COA99_06485 [Moraxellaceae bacterium]|nr:MAG: hypothetical protein COA99_06485 [Moraxellaceae bacterium]